MGRKWRKSWRFCCPWQKAAVSPSLMKRLPLPWSAGGPAASLPAITPAGSGPAYAPAYRVIRREYVWILPLLAAIDRKMAEQGRALVAVEGGSASGKTTLAALLGRIYGCNVFHMDDFFLRPEQRTAERLAEPGGNVDRERFYEEVLRPLTRGRPVAYRRYDCHAQTLGEAVEIAPRPLNIVEGAYSMHPALAGSYDLSVFLRVPPDLQRARILARNGPEAGQRFFTQWIPLEERYFAALDPAGRCDMILEVEP